MGHAELILRVRMIRTQAREGIRTKVRVKDSGMQHSAQKWAAQILSQRFYRKSVEEALQYMLDKPVGHYVFIRPENKESDRFAVLLRDKGNTVRYDIRPNENYSKYIMSTLHNGETCYNSIAELLSQWDESCVDYEMIRQMEREELSGSTGAQNRVNVSACEGAPTGSQSGGSDDRGRGLLRHVEARVHKGPSIHRSRKVRYYTTDRVGTENIRDTRDAVGVQAGSRCQVDEVYSLLGSVKLSDQPLCPKVHDNDEADNTGDDGDTDDTDDDDEGPLLEQRRRPSVHRSLKKLPDAARRRVAPKYEEVAEVEYDRDDHEGPLPARRRGPSVHRSLKRLPNAARRRVAHDYDDV